MNFDIPPDVESRLKGAALRRGMAAADYAIRLIIEHLPPEETDSIEENDDEARLRGTLPTNIARDPMFTQPVALRIDELPKWKPQVVLTRRTSAEADDV